MSLPDLRPYQADLITQAAHTLAAHPGDGCLIQLPTGGGKTLVALHIAERHLARSPAHVVGFFGHRDELLEQPLRKLRGYGADVSVIRAGEPIRHGARFYLVSIQTALSRGVASLPRFSLVFYDEARHYTSAPEWFGVAEAVGRDAVRVGLDATPTGDLRPLFRHIVRGPSMRTLVEQGHLVPIVTRAPASPVDALAAHPLDAYQRYLEGRATIIFCRDVAHAVATAEEARARGITAACVEGGMPERARRQAFEDYQRGAVDVLTNVFVCTEGTDLPLTEGIIVARGCSSEAMWVQMVGRGARLHPGKRGCLNLDLLGHVHRFGLPEDDREWNVEGAAARRSASLPAVVRCPACLAWGPPSSVCPGCGRRTPPAPPPRVRAKDLIEVRRGEDDSLKRETLVRFVREAVEKGHRPWSAAFRYAGKYGAKPTAAEMQAVIAEVVGGGVAA